MDTNLTHWIDRLSVAYQQETVIRILISKSSKSNDWPEKVNMKIINTQQNKKINVVFEYKTKHITKNFSLEELMTWIGENVGVHYKNAILFTTQEEIRLSYNKKWESRLDVNTAQCTVCADNAHNHEKDRLIDIENNEYLKLLGVLSASGNPLQGMQGKFRQINKYIETIDSLLRHSTLNNSQCINIVDMGSGKGYLTFAIYDFIKNRLKKDCHVSGVEMRADLVQKCNHIAKQCSFDQLVFVQGDIKSFPKEHIDVLIALHACDTATDDAIFQGITNKSEIIITAPCCHKQIRKEMKAQEPLSYITNHGIFEERQAEMLTDTLRALVLESRGYKTKVFEFIADAHTHKNVMITGVKPPHEKEDVACKKKIAELKKMFGIEYFYLEEILKHE